MEDFHEATSILFKVLREQTQTDFLDWSKRNSWEIFDSRTLLMHPMVRLLNVNLGDDSAIFIWIKNIFY